MKYFLFLMIGIFGHGCAAKKLALENADTLIEYQITKRLPLYSTQKDELAKDVDSILNSTKSKVQEILPIIDELDFKNEEHFKDQYQKLEGFYRLRAKDFSVLTAKYLAKLDSKQQKKLFEKLDDENRDILEKEKEDRIDSVEDRFKSFLGSINSQQKQIVREYADYFHLRAKNRLDGRIKLHQDLKAVYNQDISESSKASLIQESLNKYQEESIVGNKNFEIMKKVVPTLEKKQREHFRKEAMEIKDLLKYFNTINY